MALGELTKQFAQQALGNQLKDVLDAKPSAAAQNEPVGALIAAQLQAMQNALKEEQELIVLLNTGTETIRVLEFFMPSWRIVVLTGLDGNKNLTRVVSPIESAQLICKVTKAHAGGKPAKVNFILPKSKPE